DRLGMDTVLGLFNEEKTGRPLQIGEEGLRDDVERSIRSARRRNLEVAIVGYDEVRVPVVITDHDVESANLREGDLYLLEEQLPFVGILLPHLHGEPRNVFGGAH